jgi:hypothetical protein
MNFILLSTITICIFILIMENSNPEGIKVIYKVIWKKIKEYWKALKEYESGN